MRLKDLTSRVYDGKDCVMFNYVLKGDSREDDQLVMFRRKYNGNTITSVWEVQTEIHRTEYLDARNFSACIQLPDNASLTIICIAGLEALKMLAQNEMQQITMLDCAIGGVIYNAQNRIDE